MDNDASPTSELDMDMPGLNLSPLTPIVVQAKHNVYHAQPTGKLLQHFGLLQFLAFLGMKGGIEGGRLGVRLAYRL